MPPKGEGETTYGSPWGGVDYSRPYNVLDPQFLAPGSVNTSQINGFLTSSPWIAGSPYTTALASNEYVLGYFPMYDTSSGTSVITFTVIITNLKVYVSRWQGTFQGPLAITPGDLITLYTWTPGDIDDDYFVPGALLAWVQVNGTLYFTGLMFNGIYQIVADAFIYSPAAFSQATSYVSASFLIELGGYLVAAQCRFPTGGGTGTGVLPTVAWSGPGEYSGTGPTDPWNPVNQLGGGYNELSDVPDQITGMAGIGRSALTFSNQGVGQMDPNPGTSNSGLQPFTFYHLWNSSQGVGAVLGSVAQYGQQVIFKSSDNVYSLSISGGLQALGPRIIAKINADYNRAAAQLLASQPINTTISTGAVSVWYFSAFVEIAGQLHYLLLFSAWALVTDSTAATKCLVYDFNLAENAWHIWDMSQYQVQAGGQPFVLFSCPPVQIHEIGSAFLTITGGHVAVSPLFYFLGVFTSFVTVGPLPTSHFQATGAIMQMVPLSYDYNTNPITAYNAPVYPPLAMPETNIVLRGEIISLGHKISTRRLRVQAANAPLPLVVTGAEQQAMAKFTGMLEGNVQTKPLQWTDRRGQIHAYMQGSYPPQGASIQTYYGDMVLSDEIVQPSIQSLIADPENPWQSMAAFRISTLSLIFLDATGTTQ
jgi:hypothetical protein